MGHYIWSKTRTPVIHRAFTAANVLLSLQSDTRIIEGTTLLASGTAPPAITFSGTRSGRPTPIWVKCLVGGARGTWTGAVYYDGAGTTAIETFTSAATVALTGRGAGLTLNIPTGSATNDNVWKATVGTWSDISGQGKHAVQATAAAQPLITTGVGGRPGIATDGSNDVLQAPLTLAAPGTTLTFIYLLARINTWTINKYLVSGATGTVPSIAMVTSTPDIRAQCGNNGSVTTGAAVGTFTRIYAQFQHTTADLIKAGSASAVTGTDLGNLTGTGVQLGASSGANFGAIEFLTAVYLNAAPSAAQISKADAIAARLYPGIVI